VTRYREPKWLVAATLCDFVGGQGCRPSEIRKMGGVGCLEVTAVEENVVGVPECQQPGRRSRRATTRLLGKQDAGQAKVQSPVLVPGAWRPWSSGWRSQRLDSLLSGGQFMYAELEA